MYQIGDKVTHPMHGAGTISSIIRQKNGGEVRPYYVLTLLHGGLEIYVPCDGCEKIGLRPVIGREAADGLLAALPALSCGDNGNWNQRYRENMERLRSGCPEQVALVVKSLHLREREKQLSTGERKMLATARQVLCSELALAKDCTLSAAEALLREALA